MAAYGDAFEEPTSDTTLQTHTPDAWGSYSAGSGWTREEGSGTAANFTAFQATDQAGPSGSNASARLLYSMQPDPSTADYDIEVQVKTIAAGTDDPWALIARFADTSNYYSAGSYQDGAAADKKICIKLAGTFSELDSDDSGLAANDTLKFELRGSTLKLYHNDVEICSASNSSLSAAGKIGMGTGNVFTATADDVTATWRVDNFGYLEVSSGVTTEYVAAIAQQALGGVMTGVVYR